jgi:hypothetical protein
MPDAFRFLVQRERSSALPSVEDRYKIQDLVSRPVVRDEYNNRYLVFESRAEFLEWSANAPEPERCFHEVVFGRLPQRLKFDVDAPSHKLDALCLHAEPTFAEDDPLAILLGEDFEDVQQRETDDPLHRERGSKFHAIVDQLIEAILDELYVAYHGVENLLPSRGDLVIADSSGGTPLGVKYSFHILVLPYFVANNEEAREFTARVLERLPPPVRAFVDPDVNKKTQNFRHAGSAKPGSGRYKHASRDVARAFGTAEDVPLQDLFITAPCGARILRPIYTEPPPPRGATAAAGAAVVRAALDLAAREGVTAGHRFSEARGTLLCFEREVPTHCTICGETHHKDNSLLVSINDEEPGVVRLVEHCRQARGKGRTIGEVSVGTGAPARAGVPARGALEAPARGGNAHERIVERVTAICEGRVNPHVASAFESLPDAQKTVYAEGAMRPYELRPTLAVLAQMKLGKTKTMRAYLAAHFPVDGLETPVIRILTFRQTFSNSISKDFPDFTLYSDAPGDLDPVRYPRLIVQVESLHRLTLGARPEPVDLLVLDEVESILAQFNSGLHKNFNAAFAMFQWMMQTARHVVCMDANLGDRTYQALARLRPAHPLHFHWNRFARAADDVYHFTADQGAWLGRLHAALRAGSRVVLPTNSLAEARAYEEAIRREFPGKRVMLYSSETPPSEKARHFGDVHSYWADLDVLIFTPTCSAGVSFELEHFDVIFGFFCDVSCDVETCRQMLGRVRNLRTREHYICIRATGAALPTTVEEIGRRIRDKRAGLYREVEGAAVQFEYSADGEIQFYESNYYHLWVETVRVNNLSRNEFARRFIDQVADTGARVLALAADEPPGAGAALLIAHRETRVALKGARCAAVAAAADLSPDEAGAVREALQGQQDVDPGLRLAYEKYMLREAYAWHGRPLDTTFVNNYQGAEARRVYRNLCRITEGTTVLDSLRRMRQQEADHYDYIMESRSNAFGYANEGRDLLREKTTYVFQAHSIAVWLLRVCGFDFASAARVHEELLEARLRSALPALRRAVNGIVFEFEVPRPYLDRLGREADRARFLAGMLRTVNAVLRTMYGCQVRRVAKSAGGGAYCLSESAVGKLFVFAQDAVPDDAPGGPRPHIPSNLANIPSEDHLSDFLEASYYASEFPDDDDVAPPDDVALSDDVAPPDDVAPEVPAPGNESDAELNDFLLNAFEEFAARTAKY